MKNKIAVIAGVAALCLLLLVVVLATVRNGSDSSNEKVVADVNKVSATKDNSPDTAITESAEETEDIASSTPAEEDDQSGKVLQDHLDTLISEYGILKSPQNGIMTDVEDKWLDPKGIIYGDIMDFDLDGMKELLIVRTEKRDMPEAYLENAYPLILEMYEVSGGKAELSDKINFEPYYNESLGNGPLNLYLTKDMWLHICYGMSMAEIDGRKILLCEGYILAGHFGDGMHQSYWALEYKNNGFEYVLSYPQGFMFGSDEFYYVGYEFSDGAEKDRLVYYGNEEEPLYDDFSRAITTYFGKHGIEVRKNIDQYRMGDDIKSIFVEDDYQKSLFELTVMGEEADYGSPVKYKMVNRADGMVHSSTESDEDENENDELTENSPKAGTNDYILTDSADRYYDRRELENLSKDELRVARNEIYARHGRIFKDDGLKAYFLAKDWYEPRTEEVPETELNRYEIANRDLIVELENNR